MSSPPSPTNNRDSHVFVLNFSSSSSMSDLPTAPIVKQSLIDMNAGAILRQQHGKGKSVRYMGFPPWLLLTLIVLIKGILISIWLGREYSYFDFHCVLLRDNSLKTIEGLRVKRDTDNVTVMRLVDPVLDPRMKKRRKNKGMKGEYHPTTVVTLTNNQLMTSGNNGILMKTIRNRFEPMAEDNEIEIEISPSDNGIEEGRKKKKNRPVKPDRYEDEIDKLRPQPLKHYPPKHISRIVSRHSGEGGESVATTEKPKKKKKGKGRKKLRLQKANSTQNPEETEGILTTSAPSLPNDLSSSDLRTTKSTRHLFTMGTDTTTVRPHQSTFIGGAVDPRDPHFTNQGQIRGYKMKTASKKPPKKNKLNISDQTLQMWQLDEHNFTNLYTNQGKIDPSVNIIAELGKEEEINRPIDMGSIDRLPTTTTTERVIERKEEIRESVKKEESGDRIEEIVHKEERHRGNVMERKLAIPTPIEKAEEPLQYATLVPPVPTNPTMAIDRLTVVTEPSRQATIETRFGAELPRGKLPNAIVKQGLDRPKDLPSDQVIHQSAKDITAYKREEEYEKENVEGLFQDQLSAFTESALCIARTLLDIWCLLQCVSTLPMLLGICVPRRSLYIAHLVLDVLFLVIAFIYSVTIVVFSLVLYIFVGEMHRSTLFEWLLFALLLDMILFIYTFVVVASMRCCEMLLDTPTSNRSYSKVNNATEEDV